MDHQESPMEFILAKCRPEGLNREDIHEPTLFDSLSITLNLHLSHAIFFSPSLSLFPSIAVML